MGKPNPQNLKHGRSSEEARENGRKGGIASGAARRHKSLMREIYADYLSKGGTKKINEAIDFVLDDERATAQAAKVALIHEIRDSVDLPKEKPIDFTRFIK